ncbi:MAG TPA: urease accessory protein [Gammaproteobacteria bacterium]|nr:urease accessory protein [Gammaproteobacteria bacterium]
MVYFLVIGFVLGVRHAFDADHIAAVTTLILGRPAPRDSIRIGLAWGLGHALMLLVASVIVMLDGGIIDTRYATLFESLAGAMLIVLGFDVLRRALATGLHGHGHRHGRHIFHYHFHTHDDAAAHAEDLHAHMHAPPTLWRAGVVGIVHGLAGSAALILLSVGTAPSLGLAIVYVACFGVGTLAGMALVSAALAVPFRYCAAAFPQRLSLAHAAAGCLSVAFGAWLVLGPLLASRIAAA